MPQETAEILASWLTNAGLEDMQRRLAAMTGTPEDLAALTTAIAAETSKPKLSQRVTRLKPLESKLAKFRSEITAASLETITKQRSKTAVIPAKQGILADSAKALEKLRVVIVKHEETFSAQTLGPRLQIGLQCLKAHAEFAIPEAGKRNKSGKNQHSKGQVTRDVASPEGFEGWLATEAQWLKKPTAYKYMTAVRGLGLDHDATEKQVAAALKLLLRKGPVTIAALCATALEPFVPQKTEPPMIEQQEFDFLKQACSSLRQEVDSIVANKEQLDKYPDFKRAAMARLYAGLHDLTGTHWTPSDEPDALASVDPDTISI